MNIIKKSQKNKSAFGTTVRGEDKPTVGDVVNSFEVHRLADKEARSWFKKKSKSNGLKLKKKSNG